MCIRDRGNTVCGVITESKSGRTAILAKRVIDCTGDGDIMARAGAPYEKGGKNSEKLFAGTLKFFLTNVDIPKLEAAMDEDPMSRDPYVHKLFYKTFQKAADAGEKPLENSLNRMFYTPMPPSDINVNLATWDRDVDGTDVLLSLIHILFPVDQKNHRIRPSFQPPYRPPK